MVNKQRVNPIFIWILIFLIVGGGLFWLVVSITKESLTLKDWISIFGSYASLYGLFVVLIQFQSVKKTTAITQEEIIKLSSITEWSRYAEMASNLKDDIRYDQYSLAVYKLHHLKQALQSIPVNALEKDQDIRRSQEFCIKAVRNHISALDSVILDPTSSVSKERLLKELEQISDFFKIMVNNKIC